MKTKIWDVSVRALVDDAKAKNAWSMQPRWLEWRHPSGQTYGSCVPASVVDSVTIDAAFGPQESVERLSVWLGRDRKIDALYQSYRMVNPREAARIMATVVLNPNRDFEEPSQFDEDSYRFLRASLREKLHDPLGALQAALILLRSRAFSVLYGDQVHGSVPTENDWLCNLAEWFPDLRADASTLVTQRFVSDPEGGRASLERVRGIIDRLAMSPLPLTDEALRYLIELGKLVKRPGAAAVDHVLAIIGELHTMAQALPIEAFAQCLMETNGLFAIFSGPSPSYDLIRSRYLNRT